MASASSLVDAEEKCNGTKLARLLIDCGTETLRRTFDSIHPPVNLQAVLHANQPLLNTLRTKRVLNNSQWDKLFPPGGAAPVSETFDITLLFVLLRNICGLNAPATGWDALPPAADVSREANLARIKYYRNEVHGHATRTGVSEADFQLYWNGISGALEALGAEKAAIDHLKSFPIGVSDYIALLTEFSCDVKEKVQTVNTNVESVKKVVCDLKTEVQKQNTSKQVSLVETLSNCNFVQHTKILVDDHFQEGTRKWILDEIENFYTNPEDRSRALVITALPGVGKSVLAAVACRNAEKKGRLGACHFIQHNNTERNNPRVIVESIARHLCYTVKGFEEALQGRLSSLQPNVRDRLQKMNLETLMCTLVEEPLHAIRSFSTENNCVIVIDALDETEPSSREEFFRVLLRKLRTLPNWIKFVLTSRPTQQLRAEMCHVTVVNINTADSNNTEDIRSYLSKELQSVYRGEPVEKRESLTTRLTERSRGIFLYAHFAIESAKKRNLSLFETSEVFPKGISSVYEEYLTRSQTELKLGREKFRNFLKAIIAAQAPLPQSLALQILGINEKSEQEMNLARETLTSLSLLFPARNGCLSVFHKSLADWLTVAEYNHECHVFSVTVVDGHHVLANHCLKVLRAVKNHKSFPPELSDSENYALTFGFHHMLEAGGYEEQLGECVQDLELLAAVWVARGKKTTRIPERRKVDLMKELERISDCCSLPDDNLLHFSKMMRDIRVRTDCPQFVLQCAAYCLSSTGLSLKATTLLSSPKYRNCVWMEEQEIYSFGDNQRIVSFKTSEHTAACVCVRDPQQFMVIPRIPAKYTIFTLNIRDGLQLAEVDLGPLRGKPSIQVSPSDKYVVVCELFVRKLQLRDVRTLQIQRTFEVEVDLLSCCFVPGNRLAAGCDDGTVRVWGVESGAVETTLQCPSGRPVYCTASPAGQLLTVEVDASDSCHAVLWLSLKPPEHVQLTSDVICHPRYNLGYNFGHDPGNDPGCDPISFSQDGRLAACAYIGQQSNYWSRIIRLYDTTAAQLLNCFHGDFFFSCSILFIDDSHILLFNFLVPQMNVLSISDGSSQEVATERFHVCYKGTRECVAIDRDDPRSLYKVTFHNLK